MSISMLFIFANTKSKFSHGRTENCIAFHKTDKYFNGRPYEHFKVLHLINANQ